ncbi:terminase small subunit, partial [Escherichia coli]|nr:terminase small subunit [Escherichia coli]MBB8419239.1 terminase small subunit [Escherichia coli]
RHRLTRAQADAQELKNASETGEVIDTAFATYALSKLTGEVGAIIDSLPLAICRQFPGMGKRYQDFIKMEVSKAFIRAYQISDNIPDMAERYIKDNQRS